MTSDAGSYPIPEAVLAHLTQTDHRPGVYLMRDARGRVLYVGKARSLKQRLASHFRVAGPLDPKTALLRRQIATLETVVTASEKEALILESNLIKRHRPRYNVVLKDDKRYPSLRLDPRQSFARITVVRRTAPDGALYFGPYASAAAVRATLRLIDRLFKLRKCRDREFAQRSRPCLHHQMGVCHAPCCLPVDRGTYAAAVREVVLFLRGRTPQLLRAMRRRMRQAADNEDFESAAVLRDRIFALEKTLEKQVAVTDDFKDRDVIAAARGPVADLVTLLTVRGGFLVGTRHFEMPANPMDEGELLAGFIRQYYAGGATLPREVLVAVEAEDRALIEEWLSEIRGRRVRLICPARGEKARLTALAAENAAQALKGLGTERARREDLLVHLQRCLQMDRLPRRIACVDISTTGGRQSVGALVVFADAAPDPPSYRHYKIRGPIADPDDYAAMAEVLGRRFRAGPDTADIPDLLLVDGGRGQLSTARRILDELGLGSALALAAIAKADPRRGEPEDRIFIPGRTNPVSFGRHPGARLLLQAVRDEAHRCAIGFHRRRRAKAAVASRLDGIRGLGPRRRQRLLARFGTVGRIRSATMAELRAAGLPPALAARLQAHLHESGPPQGDPTAIPRRQADGDGNVS
jgi:excinuclease ABC subunit C